MCSRSHRPIVIALVFAAGTLSCKRSGDTPQPVEADTPAAIPPPPFPLEPAAENLPQEEVRRAVQEQLSKDGSIPRGAIQVSNKEGIIELTGTVDNLLAKDRAALVAEAVRGVRSVSNRITVEPPKRSDEELENAVRTSLLLNGATDSYEVVVSSTNGTVALSGDVQSWQERQLAERVAKGVPGVKEVQNDLVVEFVDRPDLEVEKDVESRLRWDVLVDDGAIEVRVTDGKVYLTGYVGSAAERTRAHLDAWVRGAKEVDSSGLDVRWWVNEEDLRRDKYSVKSDAEIATAIRDAMLYDPRVSSFNVQVDVTGGVARLTGTVDNAKARAAAEALARYTVGVKQVTNQLRVASEKPASDATLQKQVQAALLANPLTDAYQIQSTVKDARVVLKGTVDNAFERAEASDVTSRIPGVQAVDNELKVQNPTIGHVYHGYVDPYGIYIYEPYQIPQSLARSDSEIATEIADELKWSPFVDADQVQVEVVNGKATLRGKVDSWREREAATENAFEGGAVIVENLLEIG